MTTMPPLEVFLRKTVQAGDWPLDSDPVNPGIVTDAGAPMATATEHPPGRPAWPSRPLRFVLEVIEELTTMPAPPKTVHGPPP
jgi:hypothetical protein